MGVAHDGCGLGLDLGAFRGDKEVPLGERSRGETVGERAGRGGSEEETDVWVEGRELSLTLSGREQGISPRWRGNSSWSESKSKVGSRSKASWLRVEFRI